MLLQVCKPYHAVSHIKGNKRTTQKVHLTYILEMKTIVVTDCHYGKTKA